MQTQSELLFVFIYKLFFKFVFSSFSFLDLRKNKKHSNVLSTNQLIATKLMTKLKIV